MAYTKVPARSNAQQFYDELNHHFPDCQFTLERDNQVWVFGYPTGVFYNEDTPLGENFEGAVKKIHSLLITSV